MLIVYISNYTCSFIRHFNHYALDESLMQIPRISFIKKRSQKGLSPYRKPAIRGRRNMSCLYNRLGN